MKSYLKHSMSYRIIIGAMLFQNPSERNTTINNHFDKFKFVELKTKNKYPKSDR